MAYLIPAPTSVDEDTLTQSAAGVLSIKATHRAQDRYANDTTAGGNITTGATIATPSATRAAFVNIRLTPSGAATLTLEASRDGGSTWEVVDETPSATARLCVRGIIPPNAVYRATLSAGSVVSTETHRRRLI